MELEGIIFQERLTGALARLAAAEPGRWRKVAAEGDVETVAAEVWEAVADRFPELVTGAEGV